MIDTVSGLPISIDEATGELSFHDGLLCDADSVKRIGQMAGLFRAIEGEDPDRLVYRAYRNIRFPEHDALFSDAGLRYDITVVMPGTANGEYFKTSGHYHGAGPGQALPYPEVYEVVKGTIAFVMQYDPLFDTPDEGAPDDGMTCAWSWCMRANRSSSRRSRVMGRSTWPTRSRRSPTSPSSTAPCSTMR